LTKRRWNSKENPTTRVQLLARANLEFIIKFFEGQNTKIFFFKGFGERFGKKNAVTSVFFSSFFSQTLKTF